MAEATQAAVPTPPVKPVTPTCRKAGGGQNELKLIGLSPAAIRGIIAV